MVHRLLLLIGLMAHCYVAKTETDKNAFPQGVASGDPHSESVVLWTRVLVADGSPLRWELSKDSLFQKVEQEGMLTVMKKNNYCVKVIPNTLDPGTIYFYRFITNEGNSFPCGPYQNTSDRD